MSAGAYVSHVTDNLRIWAERLAGRCARRRPGRPWLWRRPACSGTRVRGGADRGRTLVARV